MLCNFHFWNNFLLNGTFCRDFQTVCNRFQKQQKSHTFFQFALREKPLTRGQSHACPIIISTASSSQEKRFHVALHHQLFFQLHLLQNQLHSKVILQQKKSNYAKTINNHVVFPNFLIDFFCFEIKQIMTEKLFMNNAQCLEIPLKKSHFFYILN